MVSHFIIRLCQLKLSRDKIPIKIGSMDLWRSMFSWGLAKSQNFLHSLELLGIRQVVRLRTLNPASGVRIPHSQPICYQIKISPLWRDFYNSLKLNIFSLCLPFFDSLTRREKHPDIEDEIITHEIECEKFEKYNEKNALPDSTEICEDKPYHHHENIARWIEYTISKISLSNRRLSITIDDNRRIF